MSFQETNSASLISLKALIVSSSVAARASDMMDCRQERCRLYSVDGNRVP